MSIGPLGSLPASVAGQSRAQAQGSETERAGLEAAAQQHRLTGEKKAEAAAGVGATDADGEQTHERDADGRRLFEDRLDLDRRQEDEAKEEESPDQPPRPSAPLATTGGELDITV
jgi:hypothetical protein